jgi:hypothetical protein
MMLAVSRLPRQVGQALMQSLAAAAFRGRSASMNTLSCGGIMAVMNLTNGALGTQLSAGTILLADRPPFAAVMLVSLAFATPRRVCVRGMPARAIATGEARAAAPAS